MTVSPSGSVAETVKLPATPVAKPGGVIGVKTGGQSASAMESLVFAVTSFTPSEALKVSM